MRTRRRVFLAVLVTATSAACAATSEEAPGGRTPSPIARPSATASVPARPTPQVSHSPQPTAPPPTTAHPRPTPTSTTFALPQWLRGAVVTTLPTSRRVVALTFDGGSGAQGAASVLATLKANRVPATFFLTGDFARSFPQVVASIGAAHYLVGNHTMSHPHLTHLSSAAVRDQITGAERRLDAELGGTRRPWFRFPYGEYDARTLQIVHALGYGAIGWTVDTRGWQGKQAGGVDDIVARVRAALRPGATVLMHLGANPDDGTTYDADALSAVISMARAAGYTFVDLSS